MLIYNYFLGLYSVYAGPEPAWACQVAVKRTQMAFQTIFHGALPTIHASGKLECEQFLHAPFQTMKGPEGLRF